MSLESDKDLKIRNLTNILEEQSKLIQKQTEIIDNLYQKEKTEVVADLIFKFNLQILVFFATCLVINLFVISLKYM